MPRGPGRAATPSSIDDYALIGDCRSAALVSRAGSIDWLCWPRFDSPSLFSALLDSDHGGRFSLRPAATSFSSTRRYVGATAVLETTFETADGVARVTDLMPVASEPDKSAALRPDHALLRRLEGVAGEVTLELTCDPRPDYARVRPRLRRRGHLGFAFTHRGSVLVVYGDVPFAPAGDGHSLQCRVTLRAGERRQVWLVSADGEPVVLPTLDDADHAIRTSLAWWEQWAAQCRYEGPYRAAVMRSALTLKLLTYAPSGAVVAAPTTSLPERLGGTRNWDYRYCWLRDASLTLQALFDLGIAVEAEAFLSWLLFNTRLTRSDLHVLYDVFGESRLPERELAHLEGFAGSSPVRIGNDASRQLQLDIYGELLDAVYEFVRRGGRLDAPTAQLVRGLGRTVCRRWREPDEGIWEARSGRRQHTYSKMMCWVALDRLLRLGAQGHLRVDEAGLTRERAAIRDAVEQHGFNEGLGSYVSEFGGRDLDASLLLAARYGYADPRGQRMRGTFQRIQERLGVHDLFYRYDHLDDGLPPGEGAFGICSFWAADCRARQGDVDGAATAFEHIIAFANDVGLLAEEIDPAGGAALGNFPQAFTHVGLIDVALTLEHRTGARPRGGGRTIDAAGSTA